VILRIGHVKNNDALQISDIDCIFIIKGLGVDVTITFFNFYSTIPCNGYGLQMVLNCNTCGHWSNSISTISIVRFDNMLFSFIFPFTDFRQLNC